MGLEERVKRLERENRRLKVGGAVTLLLLSFVFLLGQAAPEVPEVLKVKRLLLLDENGRIGADLNAGELLFRGGEEGREYFTYFNGFGLRFATGVEGQNSSFLTKTSLSFFDKNGTPKSCPASRP